MTMLQLPGGYELDDDPARVDVDAAHAWISTASYWAPGRSREDMELLVREATRVVAAYAPDGAMVGFARTLSDRLTFAYLADVYVLEAHRGRGLGQAIVRGSVDQSPWPDVRWILSTLDAHALYAKFGFGEPTRRVMERRRPSHAGEPGWGGAPAGAT